MEKIKETILKFLRLDHLVDNLSGYVESRVELLKLEVREEMSKVVSHGLMIGVLFLLAMLFLVFLSIGLANYISFTYNTSYSGYWVVAGGYGLLFVMLLLFRKKISHFFEMYFAELTKRKKK